MIFPNDILNPTSLERGEALVLCPQTIKVGF